LVIFGFEQLKDRSKELISIRTEVSLHAFNDHRLEPVATFKFSLKLLIRFELLDRTTLLFSLSHLLDQPLMKVIPMDRSAHGVRIHGFTHLEALYLLNYLAFKFFVNLFVDDHPLSTDADLSSVGQACQSSLCCCVLEVGIFTNYERIGPSKLHRALFKVLASQACHDPASNGASSEIDSSDSEILDNLRVDMVIGVQVVDFRFLKASFFEHLLEESMGHREARSRLEDHVVSSCQHR
jgi:hypothetical protein